MRIVVDTNVFVSAALKSKSLPALALHLVARRATLLKSAPSEAQLFEVLARPKLAALISPTTVDWMKGLMAAAEAIIITERITVCRDPTDDKFLELAVNGRADMIVTGDNDLLVLNPFRKIPIVAAATFLHDARKSFLSEEKKQETFTSAPAPPHRP